MGINFPNAPAVGELHPTPPQVGVPQYRWDGTAWVAQSQDQLAFVKRTGDTMSGALTLPADPAAALQAATKQYVDAKSSLYISDNPPVSPPDGSMWWDSDNGLLYIRYNDGAGPSQWVQAVATPAIDSSVFVNKAGDTMGGALTLSGDPAAALQAAPKQYVDAVRAYAAPYDAIAYSGMQINGGMEVNQTPGAVGAGGYVGDGWRVGTAGSMSVSALIDGTGGTLFYTPYRLLLSVTAGASLTTNDYTQVQQFIEGYRIVRLQWGKTSAQPITIGFWTAHHRTGLYSVVVRNGADNRSYATTYTQNAADIAQYNVVTIPGDTTGTWTVDNTIGLKVAFSFGCGTAFTAPSANTWLAGNYIAAPGQINAAAAATDVFRLTGVVVLPGTQAPTAAQSPTIMRPYDQELQTCQRYWQLVNVACDFMNASGLHALNVNFQTTMRSAPTFNFGTPSASVGISTFTANSIFNYGANLQASGAANTRIYWYGNANVDARL